VLECDHEASKNGEPGPLGAVMPEMKSYLKEKFRATKICSPYFRRNSTLLIYGKYNDYYIDNPRGEIFKHIKKFIFSKKSNLMSSCMTGLQ
jgi:hypothetical protein